MQKLSDLVIMSDLDGTLLPRGGSIPGRNIRALERFVAGGGRFALATGRALSNTAEYIAQLPVTFPCILLNGGVIYDAGKGEYLYEEPLPAGAPDYLRAMMERFPDCGMLAVTREAYHDVNGSAARYSGDIQPNAFLRPAALDALPKPLLKALALVKREQTRAFYDFVEEQAFPGVRFVNTNPEFVEMLPENSSKGVALRRLLPMCGLSREKLVAIGDYFNDRELLEEAAIAATLCDSPDELKALARVITCPVGEGAVADLVEWLERTMGS